ncbi:MAG: hypothetical protein HOV81_25125 [Kofleriaceae bacterium]|nr:hypothetical protein [Kofleriaceae bacterium]
MNTRVWIAMAVALASASCKDKGTQAGDKTVAKLTAFRDEMCACKDAACAQEVSKRMTTWNADQARGGTPTLSEAEGKAAQKVSDELGTCMLKALSSGSGAPTDIASGAANSAPGSGVDTTPPEGSAGSSSAGGEIPQECKDYKAAVERIQTCDAVPQAARDTLRASFDKASAGWEKLGSREHLKPSCKSATDAVVAVGRQKCGWGSGS